MREERKDEGREGKRGRTREERGWRKDEGGIEREGGEGGVGEVEGEEVRGRRGRKEMQDRDKARMKGVLKEKK